MLGRLEKEASERHKHYAHRNPASRMEKVDEGLTDVNLKVYAIHQLFQRLHSQARNESLVADFESSVDKLSTAVPSSARPRL